MKSLRKFLLGGAVFLALSSFAFLSCSTDDSEDDDLTVKIEETNHNSYATTVSMSPSDSTYGGADTKIYIVYTTDGSEPSVSSVKDADLSKAASATTLDELKDYINWGDAIIYESDITISKTTTINAKAFYIANNTFYYGVNSTKTITITQSSSSSTSSSSDSDSNAYGDLTFSLASSGNSLSTHYFGSPDKTFTYTDSTDGKNTEYEHCYYQFQFSYKANTKGNWFLYIRQIGRQKPIGNSISGKTYLTSGTYTSTDGVFDGKKSDSVVDGKFTMLDLNSAAFASDVPMKDSSFTLNISSDVKDTTGTVTTKGNLTNAVDASNAK